VIVVLNEISSARQRYQLELSSEKFDGDPERVAWFRRDSSSEGRPAEQGAATARLLNM
jgi:hypothetical protein